MASACVMKTERLSLHELSEDDFDVVQPILTDPCVMRFWPAPYDDLGVRDWIARQRARYADAGCGYWLARARKENTPIGLMGVLAVERDEPDERSLGYIVDRPHWRRGYAHEGAKACCEWIFAGGFVKASALIRPENEPSIGVARSLGMRPVERIEFQGLPHDVYTVTKAAWPPRDVKSQG